jgi:hypothetical protein
MKTISSFCFLIILISLQLLKFKVFYNNKCFDKLNSETNSFNEDIDPHLSVASETTMNYNNFSNHMDKSINDIHISDRKYYLKYANILVVSEIECLYVGSSNDFVDSRHSLIDNMNVDNVIKNVIYLPSNQEEYLIMYGDNCCTFSCVGK